MRDRETHAAALTRTIADYQAQLDTFELTEDEREYLEDWLQLKREQLQEFVGEIPTSDS